MKKVGFLVLGLGLAISACGSARYVQRSQGGGVIALNGDRNKAMEAAIADMQAHCGPAGYTILQEGEVVVGTDTGSRSDTYANRNGSVTQTQGTSTRQATEWRVQYQCNGAQAPAPAPAPGYPPPAPPAPAPGAYPPPPAPTSPQY